MGFWKTVVEKLNPAQPRIRDREGDDHPTTQNKIISISNAYDGIEIVNRCVNFCVDNNAMLDFDVGGTLPFNGTVTGTRQKQLSMLLNKRPNPFMDIFTFRTLLMMDYIVDGNCFIHYDGTSLYHLPASDIKIIADEKTYVNHYLYDDTIELGVNEVIHIKGNSIRSIYRGDSSLRANLESLYGREFMVGYQSSFFKNGTAVGLIIESKDILNTKFKEKQEKEWVRKYNASKGGGKPMILDGGMTAKTLSSTNFRDLAFNESIEILEKKTALVLGIPPILLDSGNNANIKPNLELYFYTTAIPLMRRFESAYEKFFGYDIEISTHRVPALKPDLKAEADRLTSLVNNGIMLGSEARDKLRLEKIKDPLLDKIRIPANVAGSATGVSGQEGGKPSEEEN